MTDFTRRTALHAGGVALLALLAGCVGDDTDGENGTDDESDDSAGGENADAPAVVETETFPLGAPLSQPWWYRYDEDAPGGVYLHESESSLRDGPVVDLTEDRQEQLSAFVDETDFETSLLVQVGSAGPNTCHNRIDVSNLAIEDGTLVGAATVQDTREEEEVCGEAVTFPWTLVRVTVDGSLPDSARLSITDGWENEGEVVAPKQRHLDPDELDGHVRPEGDPPAIPPELECDDSEFERHGQWVDEGDISLGEASDDGTPVFALRVDEQTYELGETARITLTNLTDKQQMTGNRSKFNLQVNTEAGWQDVRGFPDGKALPYTDEGIIHPPGGGFEWELELTEEGVASEGMHGDRLTVCPDLPAGRYRFLFWEVDVAVEFDVVSGA